MYSKPKRNVSLDVIRCIALLCVVGVHFFLNSGFYEEPVNNPAMYIMSIMRTAFLVCVPLFLMLSGYLMKNKKASVMYYLKISKVIIIYLLSGLACEFYRVVVLHNTFSFSGTVNKIISFSIAPYAWYIQIYIVLYIIIPVMNFVYNNLHNHTLKLMLVIGACVFTSLPSILNLNGTVVPEVMIKTYPCTFYLLGCYLSEYPIKLKFSANSLLFIFAVAASGFFNIYKSYGKPFISDGIWQHWGSIFVIVPTVLLFNLLLQSDYSRLGSRTVNILSKISEYSLGAYLVSWIFDNMFYKILNSYQPVMQNRLPYFILIVPLIYICSVALSSAITEIYNCIYKTAIKKANSL